MIRYVFMALIFFLGASVQAAAIDSGVIDNDHPAITYTGGWTVITDANGIAYGGTYVQTSSVSDSLTFETTAQAFSLYFIYANNGAAIQVCIDVDCTTVDTSGAPARGVITISELSSGLKTITISKTTDNVNVFNFDALYIHPDTTNEAHALNYSYEVDETEYTGVLTMSMTAGDALIALMLAALICVQVANTINGVMRDDV